MHMFKTWASIGLTSWIDSLADVCGKRRIEKEERQGCVSPSSPWESWFPLTSGCASPWVYFKEARALSGRCHLCPSFPYSAWPSALRSPHPFSLYWDESIQPAIPFPLLPECSLSLLYRSCLLRWSVSWDKGARPHKGSCFGALQRNC